MPLFTPKSKSTKEVSDSLGESVTLAQFFSDIADVPSALKNPTVAACINVTSRTIASLPIDIRMDRKGKNVDGNFTVEAKLLTTRPNRYQTPFVFKDTIVRQMLSKGEAFVIKNRKNGVLTELIPYVSGVVVELVDGMKVYRLANGKTLTDQEVIHILHNSIDGITAVSPLEQHRLTISQDNTLRKFKTKYFHNSANPSLFLKVDSTEETELKRVKAGFNSSFTTVENAGAVAIIPGNTTPLFMPTNNARDSQMVEGLATSLEDICRIFSVPPSMIGSKQGASYNSIEGESIAFLRNTITPIIEEIEDAFDWGLFAGTPFSTKFNTASVLRSTTIERYNAHRLALGGQAFATQNEIRALEDMSPVDGADTLYYMTNMLPVAPDQTNQQGN